MSDQTMEKCRARVDTTICDVIVPSLHTLIDDLLDAAGDRVDRKLLIRAKQALPPQYRNSFHNRPNGKTK